MPPAPRHRLLVVSVLFALSVAGCAAPRDPLYAPAPELLIPPEPFRFAAHVETARSHLAQYRVPVAGFPPARQVEWNLPFERAPAARCGTAPRTGLLLVHGLSDSPFVFRDLAAALSARCVQVRTVLLPGHGTRPGDLTRATFEDWLLTVRRHANAFSGEVDRFHIGGFSIGGALATLVALERDDVDGLVALAPAWELNGISNYLWLAPLVAPFADFLEREPEVNPVKYETLAINAAAAVGELRSAVQEAVTTPASTELPVLLVATEADSVINLPFLASAFRERFTHPASRFIVYRDTARPVPDWWSPARMTAYDSHLPALGIREMSHMSLSIAPDNPLYGPGGPMQHCLEPNGTDRAACLAADEVVYGAWHEDSGEVIMSRLTWNPHFDALAGHIGDFLAHPRAAPGVDLPVRTAQDAPEQ